MGVSGASLYSAYVCASPRRRRCAASWARKKRRPPPTHPHLKIVDNSRLCPALEVAVSRVFQGFSRRLPSHPALSRISQISCLPTAVPYDIGHPRYIDQVARDFPKLKIMAGVSGWPWVLDFLCLAIRHENVYLNFETHAPEKIAMRGSGYEPYLYYGETSLKERICFASNWGTQSMPVEKLIAQVEALPFSDDAKEHILYNNAKTFYEQL